ncbi:MAG: hypothetical protein DME40_08915 [Verrucomicrobia bacterium]|nr:MAG: hypothetical protein DME40_08915 [Verrucomicrobiota bacterium]
MKLPADVEWVEDARLFIWRPRGVLDEAVVNKILAFVADQEGKFGRAFNRFTDMSGLDAVGLTFKYVFHVALFRRLSRQGRETVKSAFLVTDPEIARSIKLHADAAKVAARQLDRQLHTLKIIFPTKRIPSRYGFTFGFISIIPTNSGVMECFIAPADSLVTLVSAETASQLQLK